MIVHICWISLKLIFWLMRKWCCIKSKIKKSLHFFIAVMLSNLYNVVIFRFLFNINSKYYWLELKYTKMKSKALLILFADDGQKLTKISLNIFFYWYFLLILILIKLYGNFYDHIFRAFFHVKIIIINSLSAKLISGLIKAFEFSLKALFSNFKIIFKFCVHFKSTPKIINFT